MTRGGVGGILMEKEATIKGDKTSFVTWAP